jgi:hypothetical protein
MIYSNLSSRHPVNLKMESRSNFHKILVLLCDDKRKGLDSFRRGEMFGLTVYKSGSEFLEAAPIIQQPCELERLVISKHFLQSRKRKLYTSPAPAVIYRAIVT